MGSYNFQKSSTQAVIYRDPVAPSNNKIGQQSTLK